jgi:hypothetical protein
MPATTTSTEQARETLRKEHGVRLVTPAEEGFAVEHLPGGVYGFTSSPALASPLFGVRHSRNFEIHRLPSGLVALVGFVTVSEAALLTRSGPETVTVTVHPDAEEEAMAIVSLPYDRVVQHRQYAVRNTAAIALQVTPGRLAGAV